MNRKKIVLYSIWVAFSAATVAIGGDIGNIALMLIGFLNVLIITYLIFFK